MQVNNMVVGVERNFTKVKNCLKEVRILGVIGMGGIGKLHWQMSYFMN
jgi:hypothetical protein